jgi:hypothetical protein
MKGGDEHVGRKYYNDYYGYVLGSYFISQVIHRKGENECLLTTIQLINGPIQRIWPILICPDPCLNSLFGDHEKRAAG